MAEGRSSLGDLMANPAARTPELLERAMHWTNSRPGLASVGARTQGAEMRYGAMEPSAATLRNRPNDEVSRERVRQVELKA